MKLLLTNIVYGDSYARIFLDHHLKSLLDETNLPAVSQNVRMIIFVDNETRQTIIKHPAYMHLISILGQEKLILAEFGWRPDVNRFDFRYNLLISTFRRAAHEALQEGELLSAWTADMILAKEVLPKLFETMGEGFDAVFLQPARCAFEAVEEVLQKQKGAMFATDLWRLCHANMHPYLTVPNHWRSPTFTKIPFYLHWNTGSGMLTRSFSTTPIIMRPKSEMKEITQVIDIEVPSFFTNPYWADDFDDFGIVQSELTLCYNKSITSFPPSMRNLVEFASKRQPHQLETFRRRLYYPNRLVANVGKDIIEESDDVVEEIISTLAIKQKELTVPAERKNTGCTNVARPKENMMVVDRA